MNTELTKKLSKVEGIIENNKNSLKFLYENKNKNKEKMKKLEEEKMQVAEKEIKIIDIYEKISTIGTVLSPILLISMSILIYYFRDLAMFLSIPVASIIYTSSLNGLIKEENIKFDRKIKNIENEIKNLSNKIMEDDVQIKSLKITLEEFILICKKAKKHMENNNGKIKENLGNKIEKIILEDDTYISNKKEEMSLKLQKNK